MKNQKIGIETCQKKKKKQKGNIVETGMEIQKSVKEIKHYFFVQNKNEQKDIEI